MADLDLDAIVRIADGDRWCSGPSWRRHYGEDVLALVAEVRRLRAIVNELAIAYEDAIGCPPHISIGIVEPDRG